jgi:hypothetical protein
MSRFFSLLFLASSVASAFAAEFKIKPGEDPQAVLDAAASGDKLTFLPGLHQHGLKKHRAILYVEKSVEIELLAGATLKLADDFCKLEKAGEITTDQDAGKKLDDFEVGGDYDLSAPREFTVITDSEGKGRQARYLFLGRQFWRHFPQAQRNHRGLAGTQSRRENKVRQHNRA